MSATDALRNLGTVRRDAGRLSWARALDLADELMNPRTYTGPPVVQVDERNGGVYIVEPFGFRPFERLAELSNGGIAGGFLTTVELDTFIEVAKDGERVRSFDPFFYNRRARKGALPEEHALSFKGNRLFGSSWQLLDRLAGLGIDRDWVMEKPHPTFVLDGQS